MNSDAFGFNTMPKFGQNKEEEPNLDCTTSLRRSGDDNTGGSRTETKP